MGPTQNLWPMISLLEFQTHSSHHYPSSGVIFTCSKWRWETTTWFWLHAIFTFILFNSLSIHKNSFLHVPFVSPFCPDEDLIITNHMLATFSKINRIYSWLCSWWLLTKAGQHWRRGCSGGSPVQAFFSAMLCIHEIGCMGWLWQERGFHLVIAAGSPIFRRI